MTQPSESGTTTPIRTEAFLIVATKANGDRVSHAFQGSSLTSVEATARRWVDEGRAAQCNVFKHIVGFNKVDQAPQ